MYIYIIYMYIYIYIYQFFLHSYILFMILPGLPWPVTLIFCINTSRTTTSKYYWKHQSEFPRKINTAKHLAQGIISFCSYCGILWWISNTFHQTSIISISWLFLMLCFPRNSIFAWLVAKIGMFVLMQTSVANWLFRDGNLTDSPSTRSSKSFQQINSLLHLKSCKIINSALSAPTQAYLSFAGLLNAL